MTRMMAHVIAPLVGALIFPGVCGAGGQEGTRSPIQISQAAQGERDTALFEVEFAKRRAELPSSKVTEGSKNDVKRLLMQLCELDQFVRKSLNTPFDQGYGGTPAGDAFRAVLIHHMNRMDEEHTRVLRALIDRWGWFTKSEWGPEAEEQAWLLAQHADQDLPFQKQVLALLEPLLASGDTKRSNYALLFDRVAVNDGRLQCYGTQGYCIGPGKWTPRPIEDPDHVDARRLAMGLAPLAEYVGRFRSICHQDDTERALKAHGLPSQKH